MHVKDDHAPPIQSQKHTVDVSILSFNRYVPMHVSDCFYDPPFHYPNPLTISIENVEKNDQFQTNLVDMVLFSQEHEFADVGITETHRGERMESDFTTINLDNQDGIVGDAYKNTEDGPFFDIEDRKLGFVPNETLFRMGNGTPLAPEDMSDFGLLAAEDRESRKLRIYNSVCSLNSIMHFIYARTKRQAIVIERMSGLSLYSKLYKLYTAVSKTLGAIDVVGNSKDSNKIETIVSSFDNIISAIMSLASRMHRSMIDVDAHSYAMIYNVHRRIFSGSMFTELAGQESWLVLHYLLPSLNEMYKKTVGCTFYEDDLQPFVVDVYSYTYGDVFARDFYRFEIVTHELYLRTIKLHDYCTKEELFELIFQWYISNDITTTDMANLLQSKFKITDSNLPILHFWIFNLVGATKEANQKQHDNEEGGEEEQ